jgi:Ca2+-transporting ATPase
VRIGAREVVRGDLVVLAAGDRVPADGVLLSAVNLSVDESLLTGESVPVRRIKGAPEMAMGRPGGDDSPFVLSGTLVVQGHGVGEVKATGPRSQLGHIGKALERLEPGPTRLAKQTRRIVILLTIVGLIVCGLIAVLYALTRRNWLNGLLAGITAAISLLPEEFPVVLAVFMAVGARRISRQHVLARNSSAIETLGAATVLCADKTGTLTQNRMALRELFAEGSGREIEEASSKDWPESFRALVETGALASPPDSPDPMDQAFRELLRRLPGRPSFGGRLVREYPLSRDLLAIVRVFAAKDEAAWTAAAKGAPEAIFQLPGLSGEALARAQERVVAMARKGCACLGRFAPPTAAPCRKNGENSSGNFWDWPGWPTPFARRSLPRSANAAPRAFAW